MSAAVMQPAQLSRKPVTGRSISQQAPAAALHQSQHSAYGPRAVSDGSPARHLAVLPDRTTSLYGGAQPVQQPQPQAQPQQQQQYHPQQYQQQQQQYPQQMRQANYPQSYSRRTLSNATSSTSSTGLGLHRAPTDTSSTAAGPGAPRRSTSSRSTNSTASPTSYVALMRKQKATVWCDRAQHEDPRVLAAHRALKLRAAKEVAGSAHHHGGTGGGAGSSGAPHLASISGLSGSGLYAGSGSGLGLSSGGYSSGGGGVGGGSSTSTSAAIRSKIRHHGAPKASTYTGGNLSGAGVPMRLSASEVDDADDSDDEDSKYAYYHARNNSARGSMGSSSAAARRAPGRAHTGSSGATTPSTSGAGAAAASAGPPPRDEVDATPVPGRFPDNAPDYFAPGGGSGGDGPSPGRAEEEQEQRFGQAAGLPEPGRHWAEQAEQQRKTSEELRRRGSVDDRSMTMSGVRLFVANPDLSD